jgi:Family of unknown function (DUF6427)
LIATFKKNNPSGKILLFLYAIVVKFPLFFGSNKIQSLSTDGILYKFFGNVINTIGASFSPIYGLVTFSLLLFQALQINKICIEQKLHKQNNYLTGMSYLLITSLFPEWFSLSAPLVVNTLILVAFGKICTLYYNSNPKTNLFNIGLIIGIASFISFPSILFLILAIVGIFIARPFNIKEWIIVFIGITVPLYLFAGYLFITDKFYLFKFPKFTFSKVNFVHSNLFGVALGFIIVGMAIGMYFINQNFNRQVVQTRKSWQLLFFYFIVAALIPITNANTNFSFWILTAIPAAPIVGAAFFYPTKKWFPTVLHILLFCLFVFITFWKK